jgi:hypothetical protein
MEGKLEQYGVKRSPIDLAVFSFRVMDQMGLVAKQALFKHHFKLRDKMKLSMP